MNIHCLIAKYEKIAPAPNKAIFCLICGEDSNIELIKLDFTELDLFDWLLLSMIIYVG